MNVDPFLLEVDDPPCEEPCWCHDATVRAYIEGRPDEGGQG